LNEFSDDSARPRWSLQECLVELVALRPAKSRIGSWFTVTSRPGYHAASHSRIWATSAAWIAMVLSVKACISGRSVPSKRTWAEAMASSWWGIN
jgi:hypothetical protein